MDFTLSNHRGKETGIQMVEILKGRIYIVNSLKEICIGHFAKAETVNTRKMKLPPTLTKKLYY